MNTKTILVCAAALLATVAAPHRAGAAQMQPPASVQATPNADAAIWQAWADLWNGDYDKAAIVSGDFRLHAVMMDGSSDTAVRGADGLVRWIRQARGPFKDMHFITQVGPIVSGQYVVGRWTVSGVYQGGMPGAKAAVGTVVTFSGTDILRISRGQIVEYWVSSDTLSLLAQLKVY
jgi:predicted ester cyclase